MIGNSRLMDSSAATLMGRNTLLNNTTSAGALNQTKAIAKHRLHRQHGSFKSHRSTDIPIDVGTSPAPEVHTLEKRDKYCAPFYLPRPQPDLFPQIPAAWMGGAAEGPSVEEIVGSTQARNAFQVR